MERYLENPEPMSYYSREIYVNFVESPTSQNKVKKMAIYKYKKHYPGEKVILYETDVRDAMTYVVNTGFFKQTANLHNLILDASEVLFQTLVENNYAEDELYDSYTDVLHRVHEVSLAQSVASCKNNLRDKCYFVSGNIV